MQLEIDPTRYKDQILEEISDPENNFHQVDFKLMNPGVDVNAEHAFITLYSISLDIGGEYRTQVYAVTVNHFMAPRSDDWVSLDQRKYLEAEEAIVPWDQRWSFFTTEEEGLQKSGEIYLELLGRS